MADLSALQVQRAFSMRGLPVQREAVAAIQRWLRG
jgi:hypothetical protein